MKVPVHVGSNLQVRIADIGDDLADQIFEELSISNPAHYEAREAGRYGWQDVPAEFQMAEDDGLGTLTMPRGYALQLKLLLREHGMGVKWHDRRKWKRGKPMGKDEFSYRPHQPAAVAKMKKHQQGIYKSPTGSGKTVTIIGFVWEKCPEKTLILVDRINLVDQWAKRFVEHMGVHRSDIGTIGEGNWTEKRITIATVQTLYRHYDKLRKSGWFKQWDCVVLDECHHVTAETFMTLMQEFWAKFLIGVSATPDKTGVFELALNTLGEVFYETTQEELRELGILVEPEIHLVPTNFEFTYWGDHKADRKGNCQKPDCNSRKPFHGHRNNYMDLKAALIEDEDRNWEICLKIAEDYNEHVQLVITDQTRQVEAIKSWLDVEWPYMHDNIHVLVGKMSRKKKDEVIEFVTNAEPPCVLLSTVAGEALDIAVLSSIHLPYPTRNPRKREQEVGRGTRSHPFKPDTIIRDYVDVKVHKLREQFRQRITKCYQPLNFKVVVPDNFEKRQPKRKRGLTSLGGK